MKTLLVTGGAGFIGGNFVLDLLGQGGWRVINLDALTYAGNLDTLSAVQSRAEHVFVHGDIGAPELVRHLLTEYRPQAIESDLSHYWSASSLTLASLAKPLTPFRPPITSAV